MNTSINRVREFGREQPKQPPVFQEIRLDSDEIAEIWNAIQLLSERLDALEEVEDKKKKDENKL